ncbi:MAG: OB-fold domain-containing protein [Acidobacteria bacterium]|nr:OB-fold domain-containing protein [Acidobacteriota bacterium]
MSDQDPGAGVVYTETLVHSPPEQYVSEAPYQIAIVTLDSGGRVTARIAGERVTIGDRVAFVQYRNQFPVFKKQA